MNNFDVSRRSFLKLSGALAGSSLLVGCGGSGNSGNSGDDAPATDLSDAGIFKIGGIGPTTGAAAIYGNATTFGAQVAVNECNLNGNVLMELNW